MNSGQSITRKIKRGRAKVMYNPDTEEFEQYHKAKNSGKFIRGSEALSSEQLEARQDKYKARFDELQEKKRKDEIQKRARKLEDETNE